MVDEQVLDVIEKLADAQNEFLTNETLRSLNFTSRTNLVSRFLNNQTFALEIVNRVYTTHMYGNITNALLTVTMPAIPRNFSEPVAITASTNQINESLENITLATAPCAICQEPISSAGARIRSCQHEYHRSCILNWFSMSVRCPVCRHDIRETGPEARTSTDALRTSAPLATQSEDTDTSE